jgi:hypothetical protein
MADDLVSKALEEVKQPLVLYLTELGDLIHAVPEDKETFEFTTQNKLQMLRDALDLARQKYEVLLPDSDVITYGIKCVNEQRMNHKAYAQSTGSVMDSKIAAESQQTLEAILKDAPAPLTLTGLLAFARSYQLSA